jgi:D-sedoheptulose 7-phosphate isomerase
MRIVTYQNKFNEFFNSSELREQVEQAVALLEKYRRIFFIGNGGSNAICSHMMEDYAKIGGFQTFSFSDAALITCFANDYGYEQAMAEWLKIHYQASTDVLVAISSSGNSMNIVNAASYVKGAGGNVITLTGFKPENKLRKTGEINFWLDVADFGMVECFHQVILHVILDTVYERK